MSEESPLFISALELLSHATELYAGGNSRKHKFVILHLANAVELILKDCLIDNGITIYKNPKETVNIWTSFDELAKLGINVPERPVIELLIDDRNTIQHRFGFPDAKSVFYYLRQVTAFFERFLREHYNAQLAEALAPYLSKGQFVLLGLTQDEHAQLRQLVKLSPGTAVNEIWRAIKAEAGNLNMATVKPGLGVGALPVRGFVGIVKELESAGYLPPGSEMEYHKFRDVEKQSSFGTTLDRLVDFKLDSVDWGGALEFGIAFLDALIKAKRDSLFTQSSEEARSSPA